MFHTSSFAHAANNSVFGSFSEITEHVGQIIITEMPLNRLKREGEKEREEGRRDVNTLTCKSSYYNLFLEDKPIEGRLDTMLLRCLNTPGRLNHQDGAKDKKSVLIP